MGIAEAIAAFCALLLPLLQWWLSRSPERKKEDRADEIQQGRQDIADGNNDAVAARIDSVPKVSNNPPGVGDAENTKRRLHNLGIE